MNRQRVEHLRNAGLSTIRSATLRSAEGGRITPEQASLHETLNLMKWLIAGMVAAAHMLLAAPAKAQDSVASLSTAERDALIKFDTLWLNFLRRRNASDYAITTPNGIDERRYITIGGIEQWISIRGEDRNNPVILFVHGGPGDATNLYGYAVFRPWLGRFTVVQWDERGAGLTYARNGPSLASTTTIDRIANDGIELADSLRKGLGKDKIVLVAHSFGSLIGLLMAKARPDLFYAYVGTGQIGAPAPTEQAVAYRELLSAARQRGERIAVRELTDIGPPPFRNARGYGVQHKWGNLLEHADAFLNSTLSLKLAAPGYTLRDVNATFDGEVFSGEQLVAQINAFDFTRLRGTYKLPIFVFQGVDDYTSPGSLARTFVDSIRAPRKAFVSITGGGHFAVFTRADAFLAELVNRVLPLAATARPQGE